MTHDTSGSVLEEMILVAHEFARAFRPDLRLFGYRDPVTLLPTDSPTYLGVIRGIFYTLQPGRESVTSRTGGEPARSACPAGYRR